MKTAKSLALLAAGIFLFSLAANLFLQPNDIVAGGFSGLAIVVHDVTGISTSLFYFCSNIILLILAYIFLGKGFVFKTIAGATIFYPIFLAIIPVTQLTSDPLINVICAGTLYGIGTVLVYHSGGSGGGTVILGNIVHKFSDLSFGVSVAIFDLLIMLTGFYVFGFDSSMYGVFIIVLCTMITNYGIAGFKKVNQVEVISEKYEIITERLTKEVGRGVTLIHGEGGYSKEPKKIVKCVADNNELRVIKNIIYEEDSSAFVIVSQVSSTYGEGFEILIP